MRSNISRICDAGGVIGYWLLVIGYWLLVIGYWLLVVGYWLLVMGKGLRESFSTPGKQPTTNNQQQSYPFLVLVIAKPICWADR
ncbi:hypothetical protein [Limnofasciculus baicalensis]|uniref:hypothetical protein n=1 Tax=Limnofasciculus baicalensis TaxID=3064906 RepID=UPI0035A0041F